MFWRGVLLAAIIGGTGFAVWYGSLTPRHDRVWKEEIAHLPSVRWLSDDRFELSNIRAWTYDSERALTKDWQTRAYAVSTLKGLWFYVEPFAKWDAVAHTLIVFEFEADGKSDYVGVSVEARKEQGEDYSAIKGALRSFEMLYVWATEKDLLTRIAVNLDHNIRGFPIAVDRQQASMVLRAMLRETAAIESEPRFYNTLFSNCTNALAQAINAERAVIPWHYSFILTGYSDRYLHQLGFVGDPAGSYEALAKDAQKKAAIVSHAHRDEIAFSNAIRGRRQTARTGPSKAAPLAVQGVQASFKIVGQ